MVSQMVRMARRDARRRMTDRCRIVRSGEGRGPWNDERGEYDPAPDVTVAEGPCSTTIVGASDRTVEVAGVATILRTMTVDLAYEVDSSEVTVGHRFVLTRSYNRHLTVEGRHWTVIDISDGSWLATRRLTVQEEQNRD